MTTPNAHTITEYAARENALLAEEYELAAAMLLELHKDGFSEGVLAGLRRLAGDLKARQEKKGKV